MQFTSLQYRVCLDSVCVSVVLTEFVGDRSTRVFAGHGFVDFSRVVIDHNFQQLVVGVRYTVPLIISVDHHFVKSM